SVAYRGSLGSTNPLAEITIVPGSAFGAGAGGADDEPRAATGCAAVCAAVFASAALEVSAGDGFSIVQRPAATAITTKPATTAIAIDCDFFGGRPGGVALACVVAMPAVGPPTGGCAAPLAPEARITVAAAGAISVGSELDVDPGWALGADPGWGADADSR